MKKLALSLLALLCLSVAAQAQPIGGQQIICSKTFQVNQGAVALTKIISGIAGQNISICGFVADAGAASGAFSISYGTGTNCGTGTTTVIPVITLAITAGLTDHVPFANISIPSTNSSGVVNDVCLVTTGTGPTSVLIYYFQG